ncbi:SDR family oxidoreductase [Nocardioides aurantiacus]|uniref:SDR family oxidoreductase n=1 Tax=Nocardioides aurantiacus TaxID=86796 RepID=UPI00403F7622
MELGDFTLDVFSLQGRRAIVTGGNTGLGQACTVALAAAGADVLVAGVADDGGRTEALVTERGRRHVFVEADLTHPDTPRRVVEHCVTELGGLDVLVNSAGICLVDDVDGFDRTRWDPMISVNLTAAFELSREAALVMARQGSGKIVNIASLFSFLGGRGSPAYAASKAGVAGFTRAYCDELGDRGVQVNAIAPGYFTTALTESIRADETRDQRILERIPAGRWGDPADLMGATVFLASRASDYVSGHVLTVDGGYLVR